MKKSGLIKGIAYMIIGIFLIFWAQTHAPQEGIAGVVKTIENELSDSYTLPEPWYYVCLGGGIIFGILGILRTYKAIS